jgi:ribosome-associated protein
MNPELKYVLNLLEDRHVKDIELFELDHQHPMFDFIVVGTVEVQRNMSTIIQEFKKAEKAGHIRIKAIDDRNNGWLLIDCYDLVVHIFIKEAREFYNIEEVLNNYVS